MATLPPQPESDPAREGTCAAWVAEMVLRGQHDDPHEMVGEAHENGWVVDRAMAHHIEGYLKLLRSYGGQVDAERKVVLNENIEGTPDAFAVVAGSHLYVDDLKYGFGVVESTTPQLVIYAGAIVRHLTRKGVNISKVTLGIYQPRAYHPLGIHRTRTVWPEQLMINEVHKIEAAGELALSPSAIAKPGKHCRYCRAASICSAVTHEAYQCYERMLNGEQRKMTPTEMALELEFLDLAETLLKSRRDAMNAEADARIDRGETIPGWHRASGRGQRKFTVPKEMVQLMTGIDPTGSNMVTPAELERLGADPAVVKSITTTPKTKAKLQPVAEGYYAALFGES